MLGAMSSGAVRRLLLPLLVLAAARAHVASAREEDESPSAPRGTWVLTGQPPPHLERLRPASVLELSEEEEGSVVSSAAGEDAYKEAYDEAYDKAYKQAYQKAFAEFYEKGYEMAHEEEHGQPPEEHEPHAQEPEFHKTEGEFEGGHEREAEGEELERTEGEGEGEGEEAKYSESDFEVACMLLGSVSSVMVILYLVNWNDDDIRRYTWKVLSTTISIFLAVLLFQGFNTLLKAMLKGVHRVVMGCAQIFHSFLYIALLQVSIAYISGTFWGPAGSQDLELEVWVINDPLSKDNDVTVLEERVRNKKVKRSAYLDDYGMEVPVMKVTKELHRRRRSMKCYARLLAHMAGFAAINTGATMQQWDIFKFRPVMALMPLVITQCLILVVFKCFGMLRERLRHHVEDRNGNNLHVKMYSEEVFDAENDISALSSSFLIVQVVRFAITGILPNEEGLEEPELHHTGLQVGLLYVDGFLFAMMSIALVISLVMSGQKEDLDVEEPNTLAGRILVIGMNATSMAFAWCVFFGGRYAAFNLGVEIDTLIGRVIVALTVSALACFAVFTLDKVDDNMARHGGSGGHEAAAAAIQMIINALGILIGFSWERCFEFGVEAVASKTEHPVFVKCIMGFLIALGVTPIWVRHILTKEMALAELKMDRRKHQAEHERLLSAVGNGGPTI